jgi:hypothetical protein
VRAGKLECLQDDIKRYSQHGESLREISRLLKLSRNAVRRILRAGERAPATSPPCDAATLAGLEEALERARGNGVRVQKLPATR